MTGLIYFVAVLISYFIPFIVAKYRGHKQSLAIFMLTLFTGWTFIGWVGALVWACTDNVKPKTKKINLG